MHESTPDKVTGHIVRLDETRLVFLGKHPDKPDKWFVGFRNSEGGDTKLALSAEAMNALIQLATTPFDGTGDAFPHRKRWIYVMGSDHA